MSEENKDMDQQNMDEESNQIQNTQVEKRPESEISKDSEVKSDFLKKLKLKRKDILISIGIIISAIIIITLILFGKNLFGKTNLQNEYNLSYSIFSENELIDGGEGIFLEGEISRGLGFVSDKVDKEVSRMKVGEEKNITLEAKDAFGICDAKRVYYYNRTTEIERENEIEREINVPKTVFIDTFNESPVLNKVYNVSFIPWKYKVVEINQDEVKLSIETRIGQEIPADYFVYRVVNISPEKIRLRIEGNDSIIPIEVGNLEIKFLGNKVKYVLTPTIGKEIELPNLPKARVIDLNETTITLTNNHEYCDKDVTLFIKILSKEKTKTIKAKPIKHIEGAPTMQAFIMSYCPYGIQFLKGLLPVWKEFRDKANIELRFVSYTMHGQKEEEENSRMICIREEQSEKLIDYLECFVKDGDSEKCINRVGIDKKKLNSCISQRYRNYFEEDKRLNEQYGVRGSPTVIINGKEVGIYPRDPQSIANALCNAFTKKPEECSKQFSKENPSPGFGSVTGSATSGAGGSCG